MRYELNINLYTDGDYGLKFIPRDMRWDDGEYTLRKEFSNGDKAVKETLEICEFIKNHIHGRADSIKCCIDLFIHKLKSTEITPFTEIYKCVGGNYDGTYFEFRAIPEIRTINLHMSDETAEMFDNWDTKELTNAIIELIKNGTKNMVGEENDK